VTRENPSAAQQMLGGFADKLASLTDDVLFVARRGQRLV
jgi:hypothetical protein